MKRYTKFSKEELMEYVAFFDCGKCPAYDKTTMRCTQGTTGCRHVVIDWLNEEIELVPRISKINTQDELTEAYCTWMEEEAPSDMTCVDFFNYLAEMIEA